MPRSKEYKRGYRAGLSAKHRKTHHKQRSGYGFGLL